MMIDIYFVGGESFFHIGLSGWFKAMRKRYQDRIQKSFPHVQKEIQYGGLASLFKDIASDAHLFQNELKEEV
jgi:hypothetical protein